MIFRDAMDRLDGLGHNVTAINLVLKNSTISNKYTNIMDEKVIHKECFSKFDKFNYFRKQQKFYNCIIKNSNPLEYDLIHSHNLFNGGLAARKIFKKYGIPYVVTIRNTDINAFLKIPFFKFIAQNIIKDAKAAQFLSYPYKELFLRDYTYSRYKDILNSKSYVITNGLEDYWLNNLNKPKHINDLSKLKLLCVGKIDKNKNLITTLKVLSKLIELGINTKLTIVGQVVDSNIYKQLQSHQNVSILEYKTKEELISIYREHDIFIMPSFKETFGRVYAEAMTQGLPVIYTKKQGFDSIFTDGEVGYSVPSKDVDYIVRSIIQITENYTKTSANCIEASNRFNWSIITKELENIYINSKRGT
jgi:glycosyltransferase involved in cell wall biosynthesis